MANQINRLETGQPNVGDLPKGSGRRDFLRGLGLGASVAAMGATSFNRSNALAAQANLDVAILEFALNLEYLEAEFYLLAAYGTGLAPADIGSNPGTVTGGQKVTFTSPINQAYAIEIANEEQKHVQFLRAALQAATGPPRYPARRLILQAVFRGSLARRDFRQDLLVLLMIPSSSWPVTFSRTSASPPITAQRR